MTKNLEKTWNLVFGKKWEPCSKVNGKRGTNYSSIQESSLVGNIQDDPEIPFNIRVSFDNFP